MKLELLSYRRNMKSLIVKILQYGRPKNENCLEHFNLDPKILLQFDIFFFFFGIQLDKFTVQNGLKIKVW